ncbi:MAG: pantoate--beta-alanine ligase [Gammaproteobacteria bacterium]|nr:pantoate--beta-alanine ligase [Gammaproteobacteria bacterium]MCI0591306.1 pantoate--beta-alanine ligase [Gammaproteobacteria bacterium]
MQSVQHIAALRDIVSQWRIAGQRVALVPTMGALHAGHLYLVKRALAIANRTVASIFVNPIQFVVGEDYEAYPRAPDEDSRKLADAGADLLFAPSVDELFPGGCEGQTRMMVPSLDHVLCGAFRPGHFAGVATIVTKLFNIVQPDVALFGEKDYQQLLLIKRMAKDLCMPVEIVPVPTVREHDGLAMSSRNSYLSEEERRIAPRLFEILRDAATRIRDSEADYARCEAMGMRDLADAGFRPEYFKVCRAEDLSVPKEGETGLVILAAAWLGKVRLIDNIAVQYYR